MLNTNKSTVVITTTTKKQYGSKKQIINEIGKIQTKTKTNKPKTKN